MLRRARCAIAAASITLASVGCQDAARPVGSIGPTMSRVVDESAPLVLHIVSPQATDADINYVPPVNPQLNHHYVWLNAAAPGNSKLFVFMPGTRNVPASWLLLEQEAARMGFAVIGLMYQNDVEVINACRANPDPDCSGNMRLEILDGIDRSGFVNVTPANGVFNRLTKLLTYLDGQYPDEGWSRFLQGGEPKWSQIVVSGQSQGSGEAALIGKLYHVDRVVMFSGPPEQRIPEEIDRWISIGATPAAKYFALYHDQDHVVAGIRVNLPAFDLERFGPPVQVELSAPPYDGAHILFTDLRPTLGYAQPNAHQSTARDNNTPIGPDGVPLLRDAWRYLLRNGTQGGQNVDDND
jgi:hypothetical protein